MKHILLAGSLIWAAASLSVAAPVMRVMAGVREGTALLNNGDFERSAAGQAVSWQPAPGGCGVAEREGREGSRALVCENAKAGTWSGASQTLSLNRTEIAPLVIRGWSRAENVSGSADNDYSLYVDIVYADNTPLWGQTANFRCGTHGWEQRELVILPEKPVKSLTLHCILRGHSGKAWFDDVEVKETRAEGGEILFQGTPMRPQKGLREKSASVAKSLATGDGLKLVLQDNKVRSLQVDGRELTGGAASGFLARDVAANSDLFDFKEGACPELGLKVRAEFTAGPDAITIRGRLTDTTGKDRAVMLLFALPLDATGWRWGDDIRRSRVVEGGGEFANTVSVRCGATGTMSLYPLAALSDARTGVTLAVDMGQPAQYRLTYHPGTKQFFIAYDFGLVRESEHFPSSADFNFLLYRFEPRWGFRAAFEKLTRLFPACFEVRSKEQGIWMPFTDISKVEGWEDLGFRYHEGNNNVPWDDAHGILSFRYTEPMTWWMPMKKDLARTEAEACRVRDELATNGSGFTRTMAQAAQTAGMADAEGRPFLLFRNEPWCDGAVWSLNPNPALPGTNNGAAIYWNEAVKKRLYGSPAKGALDGEYLDSLEGYVTADLNFRRDHFRFTTVPLTFTSDTKQPGLAKGLAVFEFTRWFCEDVHRLGKLTFANSVPDRFTFLCPWLDVMGTETDWLPGGKYRPASDAHMSLWRTMSGQKPYLLLMNTDFDAFTPDLVEKYFQRSLFYGMYPSMFSHNAADNPYWQSPKWYNRDRALFKRYQPLIRKVAQAGWEPVTGATCDNPRILMERFGGAGNKEVYLTFLNDTDQPQSGTWTTDPGVVRLPATLAVHSALSGQRPAKKEKGWLLSLGPQEVEVIQITGSAD